MTRGRLIACLLFGIGACDQPASSAADRTPTERPVGVSISGFAQIGVSGSL